MKIDQDEFDLIWYTTGLEMYDEMPIIEYNEVKEDYVLNEFVLAIDTSGSCSGSVMENFLSQTIKIFKDMEIGNQVNIKIIQCDDEIVDEKDIASQFDIENYISDFEAFGFGGTDFNPVFDRIKELQSEGFLQNLKGLIYLSDGYGAFPLMKQSL
jgi:predicted metal-dependent peptidase